VREAGKALDFYSAAVQPQFPAQIHGMVDALDGRGGRARQKSSAPRLARFVPSVDPGQWTRPGLAPNCPCRPCRHAGVS